MLSTNPVKIYIRKEERSLTNNLNFWGWQWAHHLPYQNSRWWSHKWVPDTHVRDLDWLLGSQLSPGPGGVTVSFFLSLWDKMWRRKITEILMIMILYIVLGWCVYLCLIFKVYLFERHWEGENLASSGSLLKWLQQLGLSQEKARRKPGARNFILLHQWHGFKYLIHFLPFLIHCRELDQR